uniref:Uncharacterized protein n=1 Tax=Chromera velia CCMP2878 TaxID=1169474 RepID=A0A0G4IFE8_9ALVE|eukprot:Cvel_2475.t1-p1 / transcript=Cvel_2475.t1 / gene=Cvel_2475 / organism=Chromera_velia_CCMP2878 / gene_product=hypothetical protein / transcript_product=hypothetical protein / location=Cvel_scaffold97:79190-81151(-) / protein_length=588 / sequence_SO=supercontig / SO=protein_coding / is_pseudo=false
MMVFARRLSIPLCLLAPDTSIRFDILTIHAVLFLLLQAVMRPCRSRMLNCIEFVSLLGWFLGVMTLRLVANIGVPLGVRVALVLLLFVYMAAFAVFSSGFIVLGAVLHYRGRAEAEALESMKERPREGGGSRWLSLSPFEGGEISKGGCYERGRTGCCGFLLRVFRFCGCANVRMERLRVRLQEGGHDPVLLQVLPVRSLRRKGRVGVGKRRRRGGPPLSATVPLCPVKHSKLSKRCESILEEEVVAVGRVLNEAWAVEQMGRGDGQTAEPFLPPPGVLRLPLLVSFCIRLSLLCTDSMDQSTWKEDSEKRFIAHVCEETAEHCAIVREILRVPHPMPPRTPDRSGSVSPSRPLLTAQQLPDPSTGSRAPSEPSPEEAEAAGDGREEQQLQAQFSSAHLPRPVSTQEEEGRPPVAEPRPPQIGPVEERIDEDRSDFSLGDFPWGDPVLEEFDREVRKGTVKPDSLPRTSTSSSAVSVRRILPPDIPVADQDRLGKENVNPKDRSAATSRPAGLEEAATSRPAELEEAGGELGSALDGKLHSQQIRSAATVRGRHRHALRQTRRQTLDGLLFGGGGLGGRRCGWMGVCL